MYHYIQSRQQQVLGEEQFLEMFRSIERMDQNNGENVEEQQPEANELMPNENNQLRQRQNP